MAGINLRSADVAPGRHWAAGNYILRFTRSGNLELWNNRLHRLLWQTGTSGKRVARMAMQADGNLVIYDTSQKPLWHSGTHGNSAAYLAVQEDGNLVIYSQDNRPLWNTATHGR